MFDRRLGAGWREVNITNLFLMAWVSRLESEIRLQLFVSPNHAIKNCDVSETGSRSLDIFIRVYHTAVHLFLGTAV